MNELIIPILTALIIGLAGLIANIFITTRPKLTLEFDIEGSSRKSTGLSEENDRTKPIFIGHGIYHFNYTWYCKLTIRNITEFKAYNPILLYDNAFQFKKNEDLQSVKPQSRCSNLEQAVNQIFTSFSVSRASA